MMVEKLKLLSLSPPLYLRMYGSWKITIYTCIHTYICNLMLNLGPIRPQKEPLKLQGPFKFDLHNAVWWLNLLLERWAESFQGCCMKREFHLAPQSKMRHLKKIFHFNHSHHPHLQFPNNFLFVLVYLPWFAAKLGL